MGIKHILLFLFLLPLAGTLKSQSVEYGVELDTNHMMIGDQQHLTFKLKGELGMKISFPQLKDTVTKGVEVISGPIFDSIQEADGRWLFEAKYVISAFDTGVYVLPAMPISIESNEYNNVLRTEPMAFVVNTYQVDAEKGNYDIVMPYKAPLTFIEVLPYLLYGLIAVVILLLAWWFWRRYKKNKPLFTPKKEEIPPYIKAIRSLDEIKNDKLWQSGYEKEYYTRLTDIVRQYLGGEFNISAMEQTSNETLKEMDGCQKIDKSEREKMAEMLSTADFVKFAKYTPLQDENARYLDSAYSFVNTTHQRLQAERDEQERIEEEERKRLEEVARVEEEKRVKEEEKAQITTEEKIEN